MDLLYFLAGLALIIGGAHFLVEGASSIARKFRMPQFLIGMTIVGIGTSMPELVVSLIAALNGSGDIAIGNVTGSNAANILLILGATVLIRPVMISRSTLRFDMPFNILSVILLLFFCFGLTFWKGEPGVITRWEGAIFLAMFAFFMIYSFRSARKEGIPDEETDTKSGAKERRGWLMALMVVGGLAALIFGGRFFVGGATNIARTIGVSDAVISITIIALGTSLPELATAVMAAIKGNTQLALGNIIGSNIFNVYLILGVSSVASPLGTGTIVPMDLYVNILAATMLLLTAFVFRRNRIDRPEGVIFLLTYIAYVYLLISR